MSQQDTPQLWDRLLEANLRSWTTRTEMVEGAVEELRQLARNARRLGQLEADVVRTTQARDAARRDLVAIERRRELAIQEAVDEASKAAFRRTAKVAEARERAEAWQDEQLGPTRRATRSRLNRAEAEVDRLNAERVPLARNPVLHDAMLVDWLALLSQTIEQTSERDQRRHAELRTPWERRRARADVVAARLSAARHPDDVAFDAAFGEGPIHVVGGDVLAVVEVRDGRDVGLRAEAVDGVVHLRQVRPDGDAPVGLTDGSTLRLVEATTRVTAATRMRPTPVVCLTGWQGPARAVDGLWLCGPDSLADVLDTLPRMDVDADLLHRAAQSLASMPLPLTSTPAPAPLDHLLPVAIEDVPQELPALRRLVTSAHEAATSHLARTAHATAA